MIERIFHKSKNFKEAEEWDIRQHIEMTTEDRQDVAKELRERVYGRKNIDVKESYIQK